MEEYRKRLQQATAEDAQITFFGRLLDGLMMLQWHNKDIENIKTYICEEAQITDGILRSLCNKDNPALRRGFPLFELAISTQPYSTRIATYYTVVEEDSPYFVIEFEQIDTGEVKKIAFNAGGISEVLIGVLDTVNKERERDRIRSNQRKIDYHHEFYKRRK